MDQCSSPRRHVSPESNFFGLVKGLLVPEVGNGAGSPVRWHLALAPKKVGSSRLAVDYFFDILRALQELDQELRIEDLGVANYSGRHLEGPRYQLGVLQLQVFVFFRSVSWHLFHSEDLSYFANAGNCEIIHGSESGSWEAKLDKLQNIETNVGPLAPSEWVAGHSCVQRVSNYFFGIRGEENPSFGAGNVSQSHLNWKLSTKRQKDLQDEVMLNQSQFVPIVLGKGYFGVQRRKVNYEAFAWLVKGLGWSTAGYFPVL